MFSTIVLASIYAPLNSYTLSVASPESLYQYQYSVGGSAIPATSVTFTDYSLALQFSGVSNMIYRMRMVERLYMWSLWVR